MLQVYLCVVYMMRCVLCEVIRALVACYCVWLWSMCCGGAPLCRVVVLMCGVVVLECAVVVVICVYCTVSAICTVRWLIKFMI